MKVALRLILLFIFIFQFAYSQKHEVFICTYSSTPILKDSKIEIIPSLNSFIAELKSKWNDDYYLQYVDIFYDKSFSSEWIGVIVKGDVNTSFVIEKDIEGFKTSLLKEKAKSYVPIDICYDLDSDIYFATLLKDNNSKQFVKIYSSLSKMKDDINPQWKKGLRIFGIEFIDSFEGEYWAAIWSDAIQFQQAYNISSNIEEFQLDVKERIQKGYVLQDVQADYYKIVSFFLKSPLPFFWEGYKNKANLKRHIEELKNNNFYTWNLVYLE